MRERTTNRLVRLFTVFSVALTLMFTVLPIAPAQAEKWQTTPTGYWWLHGVSDDQIKTRIDEGFRLIDIEVEQASPLRFSAAFVRNAGVHQKGWWWYYGMSANVISDKIQEHQARIIDLETYWHNGQQRFAVVMVANTGAQAKGWWWYYNVTPTFIADKLKEHQARLIDIESYVVNNQRRYSVVMIRNEGDDASAWWWYYNVSPAFIAEKLRDNQARLIDIERHSATTFTVIMERNTGKHWWWYYGVTATQVNDLAQQNGARIFDIEPYTVGGQKHFAVLMLNNSNALTTRVGSLLRAGHQGGSSGLYLKRVNGSVLASLQSNFVFEPASMIKALHHAHAMRQVQDGTANLTENISVFQAYDGSCPLDQTPPPIITESLQNSLQLMMRQSDNARTEAILKRFGQANINATAQTLGMQNSLLQHRIGCGNEAVQNPNRLTLVDAGRLYEGVATGFLDATNRQTFYTLMSNQDNSSLFGTIVDAEATSLGLGASAAAFKNQMRFAWKGGSYGLSGKSYLTIGGWIELPFRICTVNAPRQYVFGIFVHGADTLSDGFNIFKMTEELLRDEIRAALQTWSPCFAQVTPRGATVNSSDNQVQMIFPTGAVSGTIQILYTGLEAARQPLLPEQRWIKGFEIGAVDETGEPFDELAQPYELAVVYTPEDLGENDAEHLHLMYRDGEEWIVLPTTVDSTGGQVKTMVDRMAEFALVLITPVEELPDPNPEPQPEEPEPDPDPEPDPEGQRVFLPLIIR